jgi:hypothetical protein
MRVERPDRVPAEEAEVAGALPAGRQDRPAIRGQDRAAGDLVLGDQLALGVGRVLGQTLGREHLHVAHLRDQHDEEHEQRHGELSDLAFHQPPLLVRAGAGPEEMRTRSASA